LQFTSFSASRGVVADAIAYSMCKLFKTAFLKQLQKKQIFTGPVGFNNLGTHNTNIKLTKL